MTASASNVALGRPSDAGGVSSEASPDPTAPQSLDPVEEGERAGIQLEPLTTASFTYGERGARGQRYLAATFRLRNADADADADGAAYTDDVDNVTMVAVATNGYAAPPEVLDLTDHTTDVVPIAWSVEPTPDPNDDPSRMRVVFGYYDPTSTAITELIGAENFLNPPPADRGQGTTFEPGLHLPPDPLAVEVFVQIDELQDGSTLDWVLQGETAVADLDTRPPACGVRH